MTTNITYSPSGKAPLVGITAGVLFGITATVLLSFAYVCALYYIPIIYANLFACFAFGALIGLAVALGLRMGHVRSGAASLVIALFCVVLGLYLHWPMFLAIHLAEGLQYMREEFIPIWRDLMLHPDVLLNTIKQVNAEGLWEVKGTAFKGDILWAVWGAEVAIIAGAALYYVRTSLFKVPYSENTGTWMRKESSAIPLAYIQDPASFTSGFAGGDYSALLEISPSETPDAYSTLTWYTSPGDPVAYVSLENVILVAKKKKMEEQKSDVCKLVQIPSAALATLLERLNGFVPAEDA